MPHHAERSTQCRRQAAECAQAASHTGIAEVKEAYLNLEQAWLQLAPELGDAPQPSTERTGEQSSLASNPDRSRSKRPRHWSR